MNYKIDKLRDFQIERIPFRVKDEKLKSYVHLFE